MVPSVDLMDFICPVKMNDTNGMKIQYLFNEISHFHLSPLLGHVGLHLRVCVINDGQEHVLYRQDEKRCSCVGACKQHEQTSTQQMTKPYSP